MKKLIKIFLVLLFPFYSAFGLGEIGVSIHDTSLVAGDVAYIPVYVDSSLTGKNVSSFNLQFTYSKNVLKIDSVILTGTLSESWGTVTYNTNVEGKITLAAAGTTDLAGTGILLYLRVKAIIRGGTNISFTDNSYFRPKLYPSKHDFARVSQYKTRKFITVSPASLWFTKQYPKEKWIEFVASLDEDLTVYFLGSKKEKPLCDDIIIQAGHTNCLNLAGNLSVLESAALMRDAVMNYTNDSAPMHLASAMNAPVAAVYCSTIPEFGFGPLSENSHIIQTCRQLSCRPCGLHGFKKCPKNHFDCAYTIENKQLLEVLTTDK